MSEYKPGAVAMAIRADGPEFLVVRKRGGVAGDYWSAPKGWPAGVPLHDIQGYRPLVVLDPKGHPEGTDNFNPAHFRKYAAELRETWRGQGSIAAKELEFIADQIEQQTKPPKPEEPQNRYAVVLDAQGAEWVRDRNGGWCLNGITGNHWRQYADIDAVRVLSEGVKP